MLPAGRQPWSPPPTPAGAATFGSEYAQFVTHSGAGQPASPWPDIEIWQGRCVMAQKFVDLINANGGHAHMTHLPAIGVRGNSHFPMADLNNKEIAALLEAWLHQQGLDKE
jgi:hypothetical protein